MTAKRKAEKEGTSMNHSGTKRLETKRLILRRFTEDDAPAMYKNWASDGEVTKFLTWQPYKSLEDAEKTLAVWVRDYERKDCYQWAIVLKGEEGCAGEPIGSISAVKYDDSISMVQVGYCLGKQWWHQGIMTEALSCVMDYFFDTVGANRIEALHDVNNPHSGQVMKKCGMRYEGTMRQAGRNNQGLSDLCCYGALAEDRMSKNRDR